MPNSAHEQELIALRAEVERLRPMANEFLAARKFLERRHHLRERMIELKALVTAVQAALD